MNTFLLLLALFAPPTRPPATIELNGEVFTVQWSDGDSFRFKDGPYQGSGVRLMGYNTLESYGPVHRFGTWSKYDLYKQARNAKNYARSQQWKCTADKTRDHYGRLLVRCPDLIEYMVGEGQAHLFEIDGMPTKEALEAQRKARAEKKGLWEKGTPAELVTSVHSVSEGDKPQTYDRVVDLTTGIAREVPHSQTYAVCQEVCHGDSCMTYVPFEFRYKNKPDCLRGKRENIAPVADGVAAPQTPSPAPPPEPEEAEKD